MSEQERLSATDRHKLGIAADGVGCFNWDATPQGVEYWLEVKRNLERMEFYGTSDGKPYVEPIQIPTDEDAKERPMVMVSENGKAWAKRKLLAVVSSQTCPYLTESPLIGVTRWRYCRFPTEAESREMNQ